MGRRLFLKHLADAATQAPQHITHVEQYDEGVVGFQFNYYTKAGSPRECGIRLMALDVDEYPDGNSYMVYTEEDNVDATVASAFEILAPLLLGKTISEALQELDRGLTDALTSGQQFNPIPLSSSGTEDDDDDFGADFDDEEGFDDDVFGLSVPQAKAAKPTLGSNKSGSLSPSKVPMDKIRSDLRAAKQAGFRVGLLGNITGGCIICVSIRVSKLGISEEAMQAWSLDRKQYLVLLIRFQLGYRDLCEIKHDSTLTEKTEMRVALCERYKPSSADAFAAFSQSDAGPDSKSQSHCPLEPLFIGRPLNDLLRDRFAKIVSFREQCGYNWPSAEGFVHEIQGKLLAEFQHSVDSFVRPDDTTNKALPAIVRADSLDGKLLKDASLPLVAMQFVLRHFVRCTEFCLVCHCPVGGTFEALKPYVCTSPLCLYQYLALGFGPSIEWELLSQPYVVDLLVSFCYVAAQQRRLKEYPDGIDLRVPILPEFNDTLGQYPAYIAPPLPGSSKVPQPTAKVPVKAKGIEAWIDFGKNELVFDAKQEPDTKGLKVGDWLVLRHPEFPDEDMHYRIDAAMFPTYKINAGVRVKSAKSGRYDYDYRPNPEPARPNTPPKQLPAKTSLATCFFYSHNLDDLNEDQKSRAIKMLLETLPSVIEMQAYLENEQKFRDPSLRSWRSRISESALNVLRWIIASNRSCIMQVDALAKDKDSSKSTKAMDDRISGMDEWMQFRFAQGAPDKEQRFVDCVKKETGNKNYPTLFAWHGSPLGNWHSIIRQGLRYDETLHGRAFGNGVYMANMAATSMGYSGTAYRGSSTTLAWPQSLLQISTALSLNEVVNMPEKFVSNSPHYVVADIDWIQTRYLLVKTALLHTTGSVPSQVYEQDPHRLAMNDSAKPITVPITAVSKSRRPATSSRALGNGDKKVKSITNTDQQTAEEQEDDANSMISDYDDRAFLDSDDDDVDAMSLDDDLREIAAEDFKSATLPSRKRGLDASGTDFEPGTLDTTNIKFLAPPKDATSSATKALMGWYRDALKVQDSTPLHKLGWYINPEHITNMYQWIVELHSFDEHLPLAKDMKKAGVKSIVMEMRFTNQFPFAPPFIRVVQPRFMPFGQGGGGHVTEGGAICMELLTNTGWSAVSTVEMILLQVRLAMSDEGRPARLATAGSRGWGGKGDSYAVGEAVAAYERACRAHGWTIPDGFSQMAMGERSGPMGLRG
jgi:ubiquitin-conjugating enzyme E2 Q